MCEFQVFDSGRTIGNVRMFMGLYCLRVYVPKRKAQKIYYVSSTSDCKKDSAVMLWYYCVSKKSFHSLRNNDKVFSSMKFANYLSTPIIFIQISLISLLALS